MPVVAAGHVIELVRAVPDFHGEFVVRGWSAPPPGAAGRGHGGFPRVGSGSYCVSATFHQANVSRSGFLVASDIARSPR